VRYGSTRGTLLTATAGAGTDRASEHESATGTVAAQARALTGPPTTVRVVRSDDQVDILIELFDVEVVDGNVVGSGPNPAMRLTLGSQHTTERTFVGPTPTPPITRINHIAAGQSVVVAPIAGAFPFTLDGLLATAEAAAGLAGQSTESEPDGSVTAIEIPAGLWLSPVSPTRLVAAREPFTRSGTTEVWAAKLESAAESGTLQLAAIHSTPQDLLVTQVPDAAARGDIVDNTTTDEPQSEPLSSHRIWLTSSGAFADLHGEWTSGLALYDHVMAGGRDVSVEVIGLGHLVPFGHRAAIAEASERVFVDDDGGGLTSVMQVERFLCVVEPVVTTPRSFSQYEGRGLPLASITASTSETTPITLTAVDDADGVVIEGASDIKFRGTSDDLMVDYLSVDRGGNTVSLALPATFIDDDTAYGTGAAQAPARLRDVANSPARLGRREVDLGGQRVAYADPLAGSQTAKATHRFRLKWDGPDVDAAEGDLEAARSPAIFAGLELADVVDDVIGAATGSAGDTMEVALHQRWLEFANLAGNFDLAFLKLKEATSSLIGSGGAVGGVAQLEILAEVFNQSAGVGLDLASPTTPWDPAKLLGEASKIIGNILLSEVIEAVAGGESGLDTPATTTTVDGDTITVRFSFCPTLKDLDAVGFRTVPGQTRCCVHLTTTASVSDSIEASFETEMRVDNFQLEFPPLVPPVVIVHFDSVVGTISSDGSTAIVPTVREWDFSGAISMLMALVDKLGLGNVDLKIVGDVIDMDSSINLPDISLGVAEIKNFAINLGFELPLGDGPGQLSVGIGKKSSPLDIDVMMFGATFWLEIELGFSGGAGVPTTTTSMGVSVYWEMLDFDIIVVSISFTLRLSADWVLSGGEVVFTGAVSLEGEIEVLGLISVSTSLVCSLTYQSATEEMILKGTVHYCVDSFLGKLSSGRVPIGRTNIELGDGPGASAASLRRPPPSAPRVGASGGAASFADRYAEPVWADYCDAFA